MSREILFRGKRIDNGEWVEGCLFDGVNYCVIGNTIKFNPNNEKEQKIVGFIVDRNTVCQYTGLTDKNGKRIWENDILRYSYEYPGSPWLKTGEDIKYRVGAVFWQEWRGTWAVCGRGKNRSTNQDVFTYCRNPNRVEVIGNIFDNKELLEVEHEES